MNISVVPVASAKAHEISLNECKIRVEELQGLVAQLSTATTNATAVSLAIHEVAQPVTAATNFLAVAQQLLSSSDASANHRGLEALHFAQQCLTRAGEVMASVKSAAETRAFTPSPQDVGSIVDEALQLFEFDATIAPLIEISPMTPKVMGDRVQLGQVISNLIRNALEATEGQALRLLRISTQRTDELLLEVRVEDNGPGISNKMSGLLFSAFSSSKKDGAGVGLSICRTIVDQHRGRIWAEALPAGTAFCFTLPSCAEPETKLPRRRNRQTTQKAGSACARLAA